MSTPRRPAPKSTGTPMISMLRFLVAIRPKTIAAGVAGWKLGVQEVDSAWESLGFRAIAPSLAPALSVQLDPLVSRDGGSTASWRRVTIADGVELHVRDDSPASRDDVVVTMRETLRSTLSRNEFGS